MRVAGSGGGRAARHGRATAVAGEQALLGPAGTAQRLRRLLTRRRRPGPPGRAPPGTRPAVVSRPPAPPPCPHPRARQPSPGPAPARPPHHTTPHHTTQGHARHAAGGRLSTGRAGGTSGAASSALGRLRRAPRPQCHASPSPPPLGAPGRVEAAPLRRFPWLLRPAARAPHPPAPPRRPRTGAARRLQGEAAEVREEARQVREEAAEVREEARQRLAP